MTSTKQPTILVVDDLQDNLDLVREVLTDEPYRVVIATSTDSALALADQEPPDLAILDVHMPEMDGFELCRRLREKFRGRPLPIIFLTAVCTSTENTVHGLEVGACEYLSKPIEPQELRARVRAVLRSETEHQERTEQATRIVRRLVKP